MIRVQPTTSGGNRFLIGSDLRDPDAAQCEVEEWMTKHNCVHPRNARHLSVFERGVLVREWVLVERNPDIAPLPTPNGGGENPLWRQANQQNLSATPAVRDNVVRLYAAAM